MGTSGYWLPSLRALHGLVQRGEASAAEQRQYQELQAQLAECLISAQNLAVPSEFRPRRDFRVSCSFPVEVGRVDRTVTHDLSQSGFSALVPCRFREGQEVAFSLRVAQGMPPVSGVARVVAMERDPGNVTSRVSFAFLPLAAEAGRRLEEAIFEAALARLS